MQFTIFDVGHGSCALFSGDDGTRVLFDCGRAASPGFSPALWLAIEANRPLDGLVISHCDEDHVSDLPDIKRWVPFRALYTNETIDRHTLWRIKQEAGGIKPGAAALLESLDPISLEIAGGLRLPVIPGGELRFFRVPYGYDGITDLNNLSVVTFLHYGSLHVVMPGDLEVAGWRVLLRDPDFRAELGRVNLFVASHHGRENGFYPEVFSHCRPQLVVASDGPVEHASQEATSLYRRVAGGVTFGTTSRKVLTTRRDGTIRVFVDSHTARRAQVYTTNPVQPLLQDLLPDWL